MGLLAAWDARNQRIADRQRRTAVEPSEPADDSAVAAVGSYLSCLPSVVAMLGGAAVLGAALLRRRNRR